MKLTKRLSKMLGKYSMTAFVDKLVGLGGLGKLQEREWRIRSRLSWHTKAKSAVRHLMYGERKPSLEEAAQINAAHLRYCAETIEANRNENAKLFATMQSALAAMQASDPEFYAPHVQAVSEILLRARNMAGIEGDR